MEIREAAVVGLGTMGAGIAEVLARSGMQVTAIEVDEAALARGMANLDRSLARAAARGKLTEQERAQIRGRVRPAASFAAASGADLAVEVVPERMEIKQQIFAQLDQACRADAILATNTSSLSVTAIAARTLRPGRVVGLHFFNPAPVMRLVEVVTTVLTAQGTGAAVTDLARRLGKTPVRVSDRAGFVANALLLPFLNHAVALLESGYATREDIETAATIGIGLPMGPLALLDLIGLDTALSILQVLHGEFGASRYVPAPLLRRLTDAGQTGRKSGRGFYDYAGRQAAPSASPVIIQNEISAAAPAAITLIDAGGDSFGEFASAVAAAGVDITRDPADPSDLVVVAAAADRGVLAAAIETGRPADAVGLHWAGDKLAELVTTPLSGPAAVAAAVALAAELGLEVVRCPDRPGFLAGALLCPHLNDAVRMVQDGYASAADIDTAMTLGCGYPRGPMRMLDQIGPAAALRVLTQMHARYGDPGFAPVPLLAEYAAAGLGFCS